MKIGLLSPYHGGSHRAWVDGFMGASRHSFRLFGLPARFWKWRMHGGAVTLAQEFLGCAEHFDLLLATDMLDLTTFLALTRAKTADLPTALYLHENQLTYPLPANKKTGPMRRQHGERDLHYVFINYASMLAADHLFFNSHFHRDSLLAALPAYLKRFPDEPVLDTVDSLWAKSEVLPVGVALQRLGEDAPSQLPRAQPPLIIWNQRWEYDKNPEGFLRVLYQLAEENIPFRVALCGPFFGKRPFLHQQATQQLGDRLSHIGYADEQHYRQLLRESDLTVSTAYHEFFGISIIEAIYAGAFPLLPNRLSYPEIIPEELHAVCLYEEDADLLEKLRCALATIEDLRPFLAPLKTAVSRYDWAIMAPNYDDALEKLYQRYRR